MGVAARAGSKTLWASEFSLEPFVQHIVSGVTYLPPAAGTTLIDVSSLCSQWTHGVIYSVICALRNDARLCEFYIAVRACGDKIKILVAPRRDDDDDEMTRRLLLFDVLFLQYQSSSDECIAQASTRVGVLSASRKQLVRRHALLLAALVTVFTGAMLFALLFACVLVPNSAMSPFMRRYVCTSPSVVTAPGVVVFVGGLIALIHLIRRVHRYQRKPLTSQKHVMRACANFVAHYTA